MNRSLSSLLVLAFLASCGGSATEPAEATETSTEATETTGGEAAAPAIAWHDMTPEQKGQFMHDVVMPEMRAIFQEHDGEEFADFSCATCHGENARDVGFHMPNGIAPLDPAHIPAVFSSSDPMAVLMTQRVWPRMAELLGEQPYDPETHQGFSCLNCHATAAAQ